MIKTQKQCKNAIKPCGNVCFFRLYLSFKIRMWKFLLNKFFNLYYKCEKLTNSKTSIIFEIVFFPNISFVRVIVRSTRFVDIQKLPQSFDVYFWKRSRHSKRVIRNVDKIFKQSFIVSQPSMTFYYDVKIVASDVRLQSGRTENKTWLDSLGI